MRYPRRSAALRDMGLHVSLAYQTPRPDGRRLKDVTEASDPWTVFVCADGVATWLDGAAIARGHGDTFEAAVAAATPTGILAAMLRLGRSVDGLRGSLCL